MRSTALGAVTRPYEINATFRFNGELHHNPVPMHRVDDGHSHMRKDEDDMIEVVADCDECVIRVPQQAVLDGTARTQCPASRAHVGQKEKTAMISRLDALHKELQWFSEQYAGPGGPLRASQNHLNTTANWVRMRSQALSLKEATERFRDEKSGVA